MDTTSEVPWSITARNLPTHSGNPIHTDAGAKAAGYERALVAGVTSYAYCCHPVIDRFGLDWVASGESEVRFRSPVFDEDLVRFPVTDRDDGGIDVTANTDRVDRAVVEMSAWRSHRGAVDVRRGDVLTTMVVPLVGEYDSGYAAKAGDDQTVCADAGVVHPGVWPALANYVYSAQVARGSWVHTRSIVRHHALAPVGREAEISAVVVERFFRRGEWAISDVVIRVDGVLTATIEHEAIIDLTAAGHEE